MLAGLIKIKRGLEGSLNNHNLSDSVKQLLQKANANINKIEELFKPFWGIDNV